VMLGTGAHLAPILGGTSITRQESVTLLLKLFIPIHDRGGWSIPRLAMFVFPLHSPHHSQMQVVRCFFLGTILNGMILVIICFCLPETLYIPTSNPSDGIPVQKSTKKVSYLWSLVTFRRFGQRHLHWRQFFLPSLCMMKYPSVLFPAICKSLYS